MKSIKNLQFSHLVLDFLICFYFMQHTRTFAQVNWWLAMSCSASDITGSWTRMHWRCTRMRIRHVITRCVGLPVLCPRLCVWDSLYMLLYLLLMNDSDVQQLWLGDQAVGLSSRQHRFKSCWDYTCQLSTTNVGWSFPLSALSRFLSLSLRPSCSTR